MFQSKSRSLIYQGLPCMQLWQCSQYSDLLQQADKCKQVFFLVFNLNWSHHFWQKTKVYVLVWNHEWTLGQRLGAVSHITFRLKSKSWYEDRYSSDSKQGPEIPQQLKWLDGTISAIESLAGLIDVGQCFQSSRLKNSDCIRPSSEGGGEVPPQPLWKELKTRAM